MPETQQTEFYPLTNDLLDEIVPHSPGVYMLAIRLANGAHQVVHTGQTDDLHKSLRSIVEKETSVSALVSEILERYKCYFSFFVIEEAEFRSNVGKMLAQSSDPLNKLTVINCN